MSSEPTVVRFAPHLRNFFDSYLPDHRGLSLNTIRAYRDAWKLLLRFGEETKQMGSPKHWRVSQVNRDLILGFLTYLETRRGCTVRTRNCRLAAIHAFFDYLLPLEPDLERHCRKILAIPTKRGQTGTVAHLESEELEEVFRCTHPESPRGLRDLALLTFAYNTGARASEIAQALRTKIYRGPLPHVEILGKGRKKRRVPLWEGTLHVLDHYLEGRRRGRDAFSEAHLFLGARGAPLSRFQVRRILIAAFARAAEKKTALRAKRLTAHSMRHTTAVHLLQCGAELNAIKSWLGHASVQSCEVYLDLDLAPKRAVLENLVTPEFLASFRPQEVDASCEEPELLAWLDSL